MSVKIVAHFLNETIIKGTSLDITPDKPTCHIRGEDGVNRAVALAELKAVFFVKDLKGNAARKDSNALNPADPRLLGAKKIELRFNDGEVIVGTTHHYPPRRPFFFITPADPQTNSIRILVNRKAILEFRSLDAA